jgi:Uncharacterized protein, 4-oxalocrotonate tautomerase homolog
MPYLNLNLSSSASPEAIDKIADILTDLTASVLGKKRELTAVAVNLTQPQHWYIGATALAGQQFSSFYLEIKVTEGTNTKNEKASYVSQVFAALSEIVGPLAPASYIVIHEVHADAWGYEGQTQEFRYIRGKAL